MRRYAPLKVSASGGSSTWGSITGTLSSQTDLQTALNLKANSSHTHPYTDVVDVTTNKLLGRSTAGTGVAELISVGQALSMTAGSLQVDLGTTGGTAAAGNHTHSGDYEPVDATIVRTTDLAYNATEWDLAYGWGDHSLAGYLPLTAGVSYPLTDVLYGTQLNLVSDNYPVMHLERSGAATGSMASAFRFRRSTTGTMIDGAGTSFIIEIEDDAGVARECGRFGAHLVTAATASWDGSAGIWAGGYAGTPELEVFSNGDTVIQGDLTAVAGTFSGAVTGSNLSGTNTGDNATNTQYSGLVTNANHSGDVTGDTALTIAADAVTYAKMQNIVTANRILGGLSAGGIITELTGTQVTALLDTFATAATTKGLVPGSNSVGATYYLDGSGAWSIPAGGGGGLSASAAETIIGGWTFDILATNFNEDSPIWTNGALWYMDVASGGQIWFENSLNTGALVIGGDGLSTAHGKIAGDGIVDRISFSNLNFLQLDTGCNLEWYDSDGLSSLTSFVDLDTMYFDGTNSIVDVDFINLTGTLKVEGTAVSLSGHTHSYQPVDGDLTAIAALAGTSGFLKKTAADTWTLDTSSYSLSSHTHSGVYEPALGNPGTNGYVLSSTTGGTRSWIAPGGASAAETKYKTADEVFSATSTTLQNDDHMAGFTLTTGAYYKLEAFLELEFTDLTADFKCTMAFTNTPVDCWMVANGFGDSSASKGDNAQFTSVITYALTAGLTQGIAISGFIIANATTGGTCSFQWAKNATAAGQSVTLKRGSWMSITKIS